MTEYAVNDWLNIALQSLECLAAIAIGLAYFRQGGVQARARLASRFGLTISAAARLYQEARTPLYVLLRGLGGLGFVVLGLGGLANLAVLIFFDQLSMKLIEMQVYLLIGGIAYAMASIGLLALFKAETIVRLKHLNLLANGQEPVESGLPLLRTDGREVLKVRIIGFALLAILVWNAWRFVPLMMHWPHPVA
ncbi:hypothetical protein [Asticcacaulis benevestitus]|uniref:Uncharacterized protein n=1 Tax=Asticcacaulis benevestitus DSM 16100 = ATCC BAA-896 TaxID=1121022 RepID=V4Q6G3_9CAUL|nr:hypothetical protein [Asticcacaulis benevestitus]ESQ93430.1 hypothetical protein ABENE_05875 [Asticcacaulis benevestitus DSM 16100 = ATCC BAA-896]